MKKVFLTGATGFIGFHVVRALASRGNYRVCALVRDTAPLDRRDALKGMGVDIAGGSLEEIKDAAAYITGSDFVCHLAALRGGGKGDKEAYQRVNVKATEDLLALSYESGVKRFVFCSSAGVYGTIPSDLPATVDTPYRGDCAYHRSKIDAEKRVLAWREKGLDTVIIRPVITYGEGDEGLPAKLVRMVSKGRLPVPFPDIMVHFLNVGNLAELTMRVMEMDRPAQRIFLAADANPVSLARLTDALYRQIYGRDYPRSLRCPALFYRLASGIAFLLGMEKMQVSFRLFSSSCYYRPGPLLPGQVMSDTEKTFPVFAKGLMKNSGKLLPIERSWRQYFTDRHEGLGTTYERFVLQNLFARIEKQYGVTSVLEAPSFGMTGVSGINSLWWSRQGKAVFVTDHCRERLTLIQEVWRETGLSCEFAYVRDYTRLPFEDRRFSLSWNFAALWFVRDLEAFLKEISRVTEKVLLFCVPNPTGLGYISRFKRGAGYQNILRENISPSRFSGVLENLGWRLEGRGFFDIPPWPDIAMKKEDFLAKLGLRRAGEKTGEKRGEPLCILDYFSGKNKGMKKEMKKYAFLERAPWPVNRLWAHHRYFIFARENECSFPS